MAERKRNCLKFEQKLAVIKEKKKGVSIEEIMQKFDIKRRTYYRIIKEEDLIEKKCESFQYRDRKTNKTTALFTVEAALMTWFNQKRDMGCPINGAMLQEKAVLLNEKLNGPSSFKASDGWLGKFKKRFGIRKLRMRGELLSNSTENSNQFKNQLREKIVTENLRLENIYNADESGFEWRLLQTVTLASFEESGASGRKDSKDRFTALFCSNASGSHRIPTLAIGKFAKPRCLKSVKNLPVVYKHSAKAWMNRFLFLEWYKEVFIPSAKKYQEEAGISGKILLLLDNAPSHPEVKELNSVDSNFEVLYFPPNVTALIQPQDQGIISTTKRLYKKALLRQLLLREDVASTDDFLKKFTLREAFQILSEVWSGLTKSTLRNTWKNLLGDFMELEDDQNSINMELVNTNSNLVFECSTAFTKNDEASTEQLHDAIKRMDAAIRDCLSRDISDDCGWEPLSDSKIIKAAMNDPELDVNSKSPIIERVESSQSLDRNSELQDESWPNISSREAYEYAKKLQIWMQNQGTFTEKDFQGLLKVEVIAAAEQYALFPGKVYENL